MLDQLFLSQTSTIPAHALTRAPSRKVPWEVLTLAQHNSAGVPSGKQKTATFASAPIAKLGYPHSGARPLTEWHTALKHHLAALKCKDLRRD